MRSIKQSLSLALAALMALSSPAFAQQRHVVDPSAVAAGVAQHMATEAAARASIHDALARPEVREMAGRVGVDLTRANAVVDTLTGSDLQRAASAATQVNEALVGGATTVVITTPTVILILLIVILVLLID